ncbi:MAG: CDP-alcohol phosphatidyltransferase family protein [Myxococcales bacterium]|nr:CDP-alcohol phosphatidyltransferase family protein [Myxococcales bacterium]
MGQRALRVRLADAKGPLVLGMRVRDRNERVLSRGAARGVEAVRSDEYEPTLLVPDHIVLQPSLFDALSALDPPRRLRAPDRGELDWGRVSGSTPAFQLTVDHFFDVADAGGRRRAERILLLQTEKSTDGWVSRRFNRPLSRFFSRWFLKAGFSANAASAVSLAIGLGCGIAAAQPGGFWLAVTGVLFQFASMFDGVDGEMARVTLRDSKAGAAIDSFVDNLTYLATLVGFGIGWAREGISGAEGWLLVIVTALIVTTLLQVLGFVRKHAPNASFVFFDRSLQRATEETKSSSLRAINFLFRATRRDMLALILMCLSFLGSRFAVFCALALGVLVANYLLLFHRGDLVRAAGSLRAEVAQT